MFDLDTREWLLTNGLGGFASGTVSDVHTRTYHGWLFAATNPPSERKLLLSHLEASLEIPGKVITLGTNIWGSGEIEPTGYKFLQHFDINPVPKWIWSGDNWQLTRRLMMPNGLLGESGEMGRWGDGENKLLMPNNQRILIQYRYEGKKGGILRLRLLIGDRSFHHQQKGNEKIRFSQLVNQQVLCLQMNDGGKFGTPWYLRWTQGEYEADGLWYWDYSLPAETNRGLGDRQDLYSPGYLTVNLQPGDQVTLEAKVGLPDSQQTILEPDSFTEAVAAEQERLTHIFRWEDGEMGRWGDGEVGRWGENSDPTPSSSLSPVTCHLSPTQKLLLKASDQFIVYRASIDGPTVIAGYHWFNDWGRDTLIALPGLTLTTGRFEIAKGLLQTFGRYCRYGLIPNAFPDVDSEPSYNSIDAALWWIETLGLYLEATQDWQFLGEQFPVVQQIHKAFISGTRYNIQYDVIDGLICWDAQGVALTWMDALVEGLPVTPRRGKTVEINALWYSALCWLSKWSEHLSQIDDNSLRLINQGQRYKQQAELVKASLQKFWNSKLGYLYDLIDLDDSRNSQIRPNAVLALSLRHCAFSEQQGRQILDLATSRLLTPYGLRSLDPSDPAYQGKCEGSSQKRDRAYHQGTVWTWLIGAYIRAWERFYPEVPIPFDWEPLLNHFLSDACLGSISEIFDGDAPHTPRGAIAQAWSVAEIIRHFK